MKAYSIEVTKTGRLVRRLVRLTAKDLQALRRKGAKKEEQVDQA